MMQKTVSRPSASPLMQSSMFASLASPRSAQDMRESPSPPSSQTASRPDLLERKKSGDSSSSSRSSSVTPPTAFQKSEKKHKFLFSDGSEGGSISPNTVADFPKSPTGEKEVDSASSKGKRKQSRSKKRSSLLKDEEVSVKKTSLLQQFKKFPASSVMHPDSKGQSSARGDGPPKHYLTKTMSRSAELPEVIEGDVMDLAKSRQGDSQSSNLHSNRTAKAIDVDKPISTHEGPRRSRSQNSFLEESKDQDEAKSASDVQFVLQQLKVFCDSQKEYLDSIQLLFHVCALEPFHFHFPDLLIWIVSKDVLSKILALSCNFG